MCRRLNWIGGLDAIRTHGSLLCLYMSPLDTDCICTKIATEVVTVVTIVNSNPLQKYYS